MQSEPSSFHPSSLIPHPSKNPRLRQLLDELHDSHATPEEVCRSCPELLPEVRVRWRAVCSVRAELDALFPTPRARCVGAPALLPPSASLPQVPGYNKVTT
jgi:eukaryotic-like serine/threonine-protein kinase